MTFSTLFSFFVTDLFGVSTSAIGFSLILSFLAEISFESAVEIFCCGFSLTLLSFSDRVKNLTMAIIIIIAADIYKILALVLFDRVGVVSTFLRSHHLRQS